MRRAEWSYAQRWSLYVLWSWVLSIYMGAFLCKSWTEDRHLAVASRVGTMTATAWLATYTLMTGKFTAARVALTAFVGMNILAYFAIGLGYADSSQAYEDSIPSRWIDILLHLLFFAPILVIAHLPLLGTRGLVLGTAAGMVPYYMQTTGCAFLPATMRALLVSGSSFLLYWWIVRKDAANYRAACSRAAHEAHIAAIGRKMACASDALQTQASSSGPLAWGVTRLPPHSHHLRPSKPYHTSLQRIKIQVQLDIDVDPSNLSSITELLQMLAARLPSGWVADTAVRHGCVLVSVEVALPVEAANDLPEAPADRPSFSTISSAWLSAELGDTVRSSAVDWASTVLSRMEPQTSMSAGELTPRLSLQVEDHKEVWVLDHHLREWRPGPDAAPLPQGLFQLRVPRLAVTWPQQAPQQQQQPRSQWGAMSQHPSAPQAVHPVGFEACVHAPLAAVQQGLHGWRGIPVLDDPAWVAGQLVVLVHQAWGKYLPVQLEGLHIEAVGGSSITSCGGAAAAGSAFALAMKETQHPQVVCRFQVSVSIPTVAGVPEGSASCPWSLLHLELSARENLLGSCPIMLVPPQHADVAAELAAVDPELGVEDFLRDLAEWLFVQSHGHMPGIAYQPQLQGSDKAALMHETGQDLLACAQCWDMPALVRLLCMGLGEEGWLSTHTGLQARTASRPLPATTPTKGASSTSTSQQATASQPLPTTTSTTAAAAKAATTVAAATATAAAVAAAATLAPRGSSSAPVSASSSNASSATGAAATCISQAADKVTCVPISSPAAAVSAHVQAGKEGGQESEHSAAGKGELSIMQAELWVGHVLVAVAVAVVAAAFLHVMVTETE